MKKEALAVFSLIFLMFFTSPMSSAAYALGGVFNPQNLKPTDSAPRIFVGEMAPDFSLSSTAGAVVSLSQFRTRKNVVLSFIPAAWTPICSDQWPGYGIIQELLQENEATLIGISVDNIPTLYAWTKQMGDLWFPVCSDFYPHGQTAREYGILRSDGMAERAIFVIDKGGVVRFSRVYDISTRPPLEDIITALKNLR